MTDWQVIGPQGREMVARVFEGLETSGLLRTSLGMSPTETVTETRGELSSEAARAPDRPSPSALWAFATGTESQPSPRLAAALLRDPSLHLDLAAMLAGAAIGEAPRVAAAATTIKVTERVGQGFSLRLLPSRANPAQTYVLIRLEDPEQFAARLVAMTGAGTVATLDLDAAAQDEIQMLCASEDPIIQAIANPEARIWLT